MQYCDHDEDLNDLQDAPTSVSRRRFPTVRYAAGLGQTLRLGMLLALATPALAQADASRRQRRTLALPPGFPF